MADVKWLGHTCVRIRSRDATVLMDPIGREQGYAVPKQKADIVTLSRANTPKSALAIVEGDYTLIEGPGEYEVQDIFLTGVRTKRGTNGARDYNTVYRVRLEEIVFCHLGNLNQPLTDAQSAALGDVDVLFVPIGGPDALAATAATEVIGQIKPRLVVPMRYRIAEDAGLRALHEFVASLGFTDVPREDRLTIRKTGLPEAMSVTVLDV